MNSTRQNLVLTCSSPPFQLFGDTVNTAARMESNGERNRVHVSMETAELLRMGGKHHWLKKRENKVMVSFLFVNFIKKALG